MRKKFVICLAILISINGFSHNDDNLKEKKIPIIGNLYAYARYFNPNKKIQNIQWTKFLMHAIRETDTAQDDGSLNKLLFQLFSPLIPDMQLADVGQQKTDIEIVNGQISYSENKMYVWEHKGFGSQGVFGFGNPFKSKIIHKKRTPDLPVPDSLYCFPLSDELNLYYPIAVSKQTDKRETELKILKTIIDTIDLRLSTYSFFKVLRKNDYGYKPIINQDKSLKLAGLIERWAIMKHFYPYLTEDGITEQCMNKLLVKYANKIDENTDMYSYFYIIKEFMGNFKDGHIGTLGNIVGTNKWMATYIPEYGLSVPLAYIDGSFVSADSLGSHIKRGDKLLSVNDIPIDTLVAIKSKYIPASTQKNKMHRFISNAFMTNSNDTIFRFSFCNEEVDTLIYSKNVNEEEMDFSGESNKPFISEIEDGIYYVDLSSGDCNEKKFRHFFEQTSSVKSLIFDLRKYPNYKSFDIFKHLSDNPIEWGDYRLPIRYFPNQKNTVWTKNEEQIMSQKPLINTKCYALINEQTFSFGESIANMLKKNKIAVLIGENTSGTNGDVSRIDTQLFDFTMSVGKDFDKYHAIGVEPDIFLKQTTDDYRKGIDTALEYTIKIIREQ
jgi:C-terminal processing protease CtpA/Prc